MQLARRADADQAAAAAAESNPARPHTALFAAGISLALVAPCWLVTDTTVEATNLSFWKHFPEGVTEDAAHPSRGHFRITSGQVTPDAIHVDALEDASGRTVTVDVSYVPDVPGKPWYLQTGYVGTVKLTTPDQPNQLISIAQSQSAP